MREVVVLDAARTAIGKSFRGGLADVRADDLGSTVIAALLAQRLFATGRCLRTLLGL
ncbi:hypothetical protein [Rhodococcus jostii]|uniref:thiolase family protein n=1 Tax=Rhodococcus jostii TaxID=132919 RepID=UPI003981B953